MLKKKSLVAAFVGHALEHYDITLYGFFAAALTSVFFPPDRPGLATASSLVIFAAGFIMRPFGGIFFGHLGDRYGRKTSLLWAILLVTIPTFLIGLLPSYQQVGLFSALILLASRLLQGLCVGGEYSGAAIFVAEHAPKGKEGFFGSILCSTGFLGAVLGTAIGSLFVREGMLEWGWRIPFILGGIFGIIGFFLRKIIEETPVFSELSKARDVHLYPLIKVIGSHKRNVLCTIFLGANGLIPLYIATIYMNVVLTKELNFSTSQTLFINTGIMSLWVLLLPLAGFLSDKKGRSQVMSWAALLTAFSAFPLFLFLYQNLCLERVLIFQIVLTILGAFYVGPLPSFLPTLFPAKIRYSGVAFSYTLGQALFGGTAPLIAHALVEWVGSGMAPAIYLCFGAFLGWLGVTQSRQAISFLEREKERKHA